LSGTAIMMKPRNAKKHACLRSEELQAYTKRPKQKKFCHTYNQTHTHTHTH
jgi:hypothetical protein